MRVPVCVFAKPPVPGLVKTRLAVTIGEAEAARLASAMLCDVWNAVVSVAGAVPVLASTAVAAFPQLPAGTAIWLQGEGDLGQRMERIAQRGIAEAGRVLLLGADSPELRPDHIELALKNLDTHDAVIGPSFDGGYYLLGLARCPDGLLHALPWSTPETFARTEERLRSSDFSVALLPPLGDVDVLADLLACASPGPYTKDWILKWSA